MVCELNGIGIARIKFGHPIRGISSLYCICMYRETSDGSQGFPQMNRIRNNWRVLTVGQDALFHRETLFVVSAGHAEDVALPLISQMIGFNLSADALVVEHSQFVVIDHFKGFLGSR